MKETEIQKSILDYLRLKNFFHWRQNSGSFMRDTHFYQFASITGLPDIMCIGKKGTDLEGKLIAVECKSHSGRQNESQKSFQEKLEATGGKYILAKSLDDVTAIL